MIVNPIATCQQCYTVKKEKDFDLIDKESEIYLCCIDCISKYVDCMLKSLTLDDIKEVNKQCSTKIQVKFESGKFSELKKQHNKKETK